MDDAGGHELALGRVPEGVVGLAGLELLGGVEPLSLVAGVGPEGLESPGRESGLEAPRVLAARPVPVEADVAPGEGLVEERVDVGVVAEEALALAAVVDPQLVRAPVAGGPEDALHDLFDREVPEVQVGGQAAGVALLEGPRLGAVLGVAVEPLLQEPAQAGACRRRSPGVCATGGTLASRGSESTKAATSSTAQVSNGASTGTRAASVILGFFAARCGHASAKALWMRGRRWAAA